MTVVLLDPRWPMMIPLDAFGPSGKLTGPVSYTEEVPMSVRWHMGDVVEGCLGSGVLVSTDDTHPDVIARANSGERVIEVASRSDVVAQARRVMGKAHDIGEWERSQTHESLVPYLREEAEEAIAAIENKAGDSELVKELGDVLLQVLFHAEIASRRGAFDLDDVASSFVEKMKKRAPYLFDGTSRVVDIDTQNKLWAEAKAREKA